MEPGLASASFLPGPDAPESVSILLFSVSPAPAFVPPFLLVTVSCSVLIWEILSLFCLPFPSSYYTLDSLGSLLFCLWL